MPTLNETIHAVLANPDAYVDAFSASTPETVGEFIRDLHAIQWQDLMERHPAWFSPLNVPSTPFSRNSIASRIAKRGSYAEPPRGSYSIRHVPVNSRMDWRFYHDGSIPTLPSWAEQEVIDRTVAQLTAVDDPSMGTANNATATGVQAMMEARRQDIARHRQQLLTRVHDNRYQPDYSGDGSRLSGSRPDHYRVTPSRCTCGFTSMFTGDMDHHLREE